ncbi:MAG: TetR/AcrR family transcriptional regulator [Rubrimonas sp.]|uniref:TetR/AcrR family transcriptional regulator n=1 Tax=Rubrimonas sp. TaxID=2036015 RepID=UPI002FDE70CD
MTDSPALSAAEQTAPLRERCVDMALQIIAEAGIEGLSLRDLARRLGVSHQAPYKHFPSRDHLLAEIVRRCFLRFGAVMAEAASGAADPLDSLRAQGRAYFRFARDHPLEYRLMFGDPLPDASLHPEMLAEAHAAFEGLKRSVAGVVGLPPDDPRVLPDALATWSTVHGFATIRQTAALENLGLGALDHAVLGEAMLDRICAALGARCG